MNQKINEFYLGYSIGNSPVLRVALGDLMPAVKRKTFPPQVRYEGNVKTGQIGFMDSIVCDEIIPARYDPNLIKLKALSVVAIGIEPGFQGKGNGGFLVDYAERLAKGRGIDTIVISALKEGTNLPEICERRGYLIHNRSRAIKRL